MKSRASQTRFFNKKFWKALKTKDYVHFLAAVFFTFSTIGYVSDILSQLRLPYSSLIVYILFSGFVSVGYAYSATKNFLAFPVVIILHLTIPLMFDTSFPVDVSQEFLNTKSIVSGVGIIFSVLLGYLFFVTFVSKVGIKHFVLETEMQMARRVHDELVPTINLKTDRFEIYGKSLPTMDVGGDLIDVISEKDKLLCVIADVAGHGVSSGLYMSMFKSAIRALRINEISLGQIIGRINKTLIPLMGRSIFITTAGIRFDQSNNTDFIVAGHLPIIRYNSKSDEIDQLLIKQLPVGFKDNFQFQSSNISFGTGDMFLLITDGLTETADRKGIEFGFEKIKELLYKNRSTPLSEIYTSIISQSIEHGEQKDDMTMLLIRVI